MKKYLILLIILTLTGNVFAGTLVPTMDNFNELKQEIEKLEGIEERLNNKFENLLQEELKGMKADDRYFLQQIELLKKQNEELQNKINSLETKIIELNKKEEIEFLQEEIILLKQQLTSVNSIAEQTKNSLTGFLAEEEKKKNDSLAGLFNLGEIGFLPVLLGLLILATIGLIVFGYMKKDEWLPKIEETKDALTFLNKEQKEKQLTEFNEEELIEKPKGKWAVE